MRPLGGSTSYSIGTQSESVRKLCAIVVPNGPSGGAGGLMWIHCGSSVAARERVDPLLRQLLPGGRSEVGSEEVAEVGSDCAGADALERGLACRGARGSRTAPATRASRSPRRGSGSTRCAASRRARSQSRLQRALDRPRGPGFGSLQRAHRSAAECARRAAPGPARRPSKRKPANPGNSSSRPIFSCTIGAAARTRSSGQSFPRSRR